MNTQTETSSASPDAERGDSSRDLEHLYELATLVTSARDAMSDDIVTRMSSAMSEGISLLDRLTRNQGLMRLIQVLDGPDCQDLLFGLADALGKTSQGIATSAPSRGGLGAMARLAREPGTQEGIRILSLLSEHLSESLRARHRHGEG